MGGHVTRTGAHLERLAPARVRLWLYRFALNRGYLDALVMGWMIAPAARVFRWFDGRERALSSWLGGARAAAPRSGSDGGGPDAGRPE